MSELGREGMEMTKGEYLQRRDLVVSSADIRAR